MAYVVRFRSLACVLVCALSLIGCSHAPLRPVPAVVLVADQTNAVAYWHDIGAPTVTAAASAAGTEAEQHPAFPADMATLHLAMYDAAMAIAPRYRPFLYRPDAPSPHASLDAATAAVAYQVLLALFPSRASMYQNAYLQFVAAIPEGPAKVSGLSLGAAAAAAHLQRRTRDGRATQLPAYAPGATPGQFRGRDPILRDWISIKPFVLRSLAQFRPAPAPALTSSEYAADFNEVKALGGTASLLRTAEQLETARFHAELPPVQVTRNLGRFARTTADPVAAARLMAALYTNYADAMSACMEAKYHYDTWRPQSAIPLAAEDGNAATLADPDWKPVLATPNHPEYPAGHACSSGTIGELLQQYYGTDQVAFDWDSKVTGTTRHYANTSALADESTVARIYGGMHFRYATVAGVTLGQQVARWTMQHAFQPQP